MKKTILLLSVLFCSCNLFAADLDLLVNWRWIGVTEINNYSSGEFDSPLFMHGISYSSILSDNLLGGELGMGITALGAYQESLSPPADSFGVGYGGFLLRWTYPLLDNIKAGIQLDSGCGLIWLNGITNVVDSFISLEPGGYLSLHVFIFKLKLIGSYFITLGGDEGKINLNGFSLKVSLGFSLPKG